MNTKIYKPKTEQIPDLLPLWEGQYRYHHDLDSEYYVSGSDELKKKFVKHLETAIEKDDPMILVAEVDDEIVGFITCEIEDNDYMDAKITRYGVIVELFVHEDYRKQGIAARLMKEAERFFREQGLSYIEIQLSTFNTQAMSFYENKGYVNRQSFVFKKIGEK